MIIIRDKRFTGGQPKEPTIDIQKPASLINSSNTPESPEQESREFLNQADQITNKIKL